MPPKMPEPLGQSVSIHAFVDANHAGNVVTRRSHSGIIIYVNNAPIIWFNKRQNTVESSTFGSELVSMRICRDLIVSLRYKLRMFGLNVQGPAYTYCDNAGVVKNVSVPQSILVKSKRKGCKEDFDFAELEAAIELYKEHEEEEDK